MHAVCTDLCDCAAWLAVRICFSYACASPASVTPLPLLRLTVLRVCRFCCSCFSCALASLTILPLLTLLVTVYALPLLVLLCRDTFCACARCTDCTLCDCTAWLAVRSCLSYALASLASVSNSVTLASLTRVHLLPLLRFYLSCLGYAIYLSCLYAARTVEEQGKRPQGKHARVLHRPLRLPGSQYALASLTLLPLLPLVRFFLSYA